ncbi:11244_t:CDS:2 [Acaulospora colombiana]|uniref:11244_t:CDS:1 n=1 Tax=Acaulospora colombiana TaxID=27376 RepID=A0ACA9JV78_9GLOM|nr:11244_t:CDS:2 [Acaulospora colombiana]
MRELSFSNAFSLIRQDAFTYALPYLVLSLLHMDTFLFTNADLDTFSRSINSDDGTAQNGIKVFNDKEGFETAVRNVIQHVTFDLNSKVQVFEVNIRVLGALLSAHLFATDPRFGFMIEGYNNELLDLAYDLGQRLLPAFQKTKTGIPFSRVNLKYGVPSSETHETCTAGAGTLILEFGVLSRLKNDTRFEEAARRALFGIWNRRTNLDLVGNVIDIQTGQWIHTAASTGAGIDSFYEYLLKAYVLFGESEYLSVFNEAYSAILKYVRDESGYLYRSVNMMNGGLMSGWVDSLSAYFPGLQATQDPFYLKVGEMVLQDLESYSRVECGYASVKDVHTKKLEERMESFTLSETFKYLYLLFDTENFLNKLDDNFVFTTEAHIIPLPARYLKNFTKIHHIKTEDSICQKHKKVRQFCASVLDRPDADFARELVGFEDQSLPPLDPHGHCEVPETEPSVMDVSFGDPIPQSNQPAQQLVQYFNGLIANSLAGLKLELSRRADRTGYDVTKDPSIKDYWIKYQTYETSIIRVIHNYIFYEDYSDYIGAVASFGPKITEESQVLHLVQISPSSNGCESYNLDEETIIRDNILLTKRGECTFVEKVSHAQAVGAKALIIISDDNYLFKPELPSEYDSVFFSIPCLLITNESGIELEKLLSKSPEVQIKLVPHQQESTTPLTNDDLLLTIHGHIVRNIRLNLSGQ